MAKSWYTVQTYSGYEKKVEKELNTKISNGEISAEVIPTVKVPEEDVIEYVKVKNRKTGIEEEKKKIRKEKIVPGYIFLEIDFPEVGWRDICSSIRRIRGVNGFVGTNPNEKPRPVPQSQIRKILQRAGEIPGEKNVKIKQNYNVGDQVKINDGPFANFSGAVEEVNAEKNKLKVLVQLFGRETSVEIEASQVERLVK